MILTVIMTFLILCCPSALFPAFDNARCSLLILCSWVLTWASSCLISCIEFQKNNLKNLVNSCIAIFITYFWIFTLHPAQECMHFSGSHSLITSFSCKSLVCFFWWWARLGSRRVLQPFSECMLWRSNPGPLSWYKFWISILCSSI